MTNQALARTENLAVARTEFSRDQVELIKRTVAAGATDDELALFLHQCRRTGLDPLARQIYCIVRGAGEKRKATIQTGIDGYRLIADRTGAYAGSDEPVFEDDADGRPVKATVTVHKIVQGLLRPFAATAYWSEFYPKGQYTGLWDQMPHLMLAKVAEAQALRKAFPADLAGVYVEEELHQAAVEGQARVVDERPSGHTQAQEARRQIAAAPARPANAGADLVATEPQLKAIAAFGKGAGLDEEAIERACVEQFGGLAPAELTRRQASEFINALKALPRVTS